MSMRNIHSGTPEIDWILNVDNRSAVI